MKKKLLLLLLLASCGHKDNTPIILQPEIKYIQVYDYQAKVYVDMQIKHHEHKREYDLYFVSYNNYNFPVINMNNSQYTPLDWQADYQWPISENQITWADHNGQYIQWR